MFAEGPAAPARPVPHYPSEEFFTELIARIGPSAAGIPISAKIVLVNNGLSAGGAERQILCTLKSLHQAGYDATFVGEYMGEAPGLDFHRDHVADAGIVALALERSTKPGVDLYSGVSEAVADLLSKMPSATMLDILDMASMLRRLRPEIVHLWQDDTATKHALSAMIAGARKIVLSGRNLNPTHFNYHRTEMRAIYRALLNDPRIVLSNNSHIGAKSYADWLGIEAAQIKVVHNGLDLSLWRSGLADSRAAFRAERGIGPDAFLISGVFRLSPEKRPLLWLDAAAAALKDAPHFHFAIAGGGPMEREVRARAELPDLAGRISLLGEIKNIPALFAASDLIVLTSSEEGLPNVLLEAQAAGLPVISTDAGGASEAMKVGASGVIVDADTPSGISEAIIKIASDSRFRTEARSVGPEFVRANFNIEKMLAATLDCYGVAGR